MIISSKIPRGTSPIAIPEYLAKRFTYFSRDIWLERLHEKLIRCNNIVCDEETWVKAGDTIDYDMPDFLEPEADLRYTIIYEDEWLLGVCKPGNLLVHRSGKSIRHNLMYQLRCEHDPPYVSANSVNRLDRETSGIVVIAKDPDTLRIMHESFRQREIKKEYIAVVHGVPQPLKGTIEFPIGKDLKSKAPCRFWIRVENAKDAHTEYEVLETFGEAFSMVELRPRTGRTHQIRVHMAALGHRIAGDKLYGMSEEAYLRWLDERQLPEDVVFNRQALHCRKMEFFHPRTATTCTMHAKIPDDMKNFIEKLRGDYC